MLRTNLESEKYRSRDDAPVVLDNQVRVSTPENISFQYEIVGPSRRLIAYLLDVGFTLFAFGMVVIVTVFLFGLVAGIARGTALAPLLDLLGQLAFMIFLIGAFLTMWFYGAYMEAMYNGQTFGKMLSNIRAISTDGSAIDGTQATLRNFFRLLDVSPFLPLSLIFGTDFAFAWIPLFGFGLLSMTISRKYQRLGDFVADTIVVSESKKWTHGLARFEDPRVAELAGLLSDDFRVSPGLAQVLADYVDRRRVLPYQRVSEVASHIGRPLVKHFGLPRDTNYDLLLCSLYYKTFVHERESEDNEFVFKKISNADSADTSSPVVAQEVEVSS